MCPSYCEQRQPREDHEGNADGSDHHQPPLGEGDGQGYFEIIPGSQACATQVFDCSVISSSLVSLSYARALVSHFHLHVLGSMDV